MSAPIERINEMPGSSGEYLKSNLKTAISPANPQSAEALTERMQEIQHLERHKKYSHQYSEHH